jgi:hypothetical protein
MAARGSLRRIGPDLRIHAYFWLRVEGYWRRIAQRLRLVVAPGRTWNRAALASLPRSSVLQ